MTDVRASFDALRRDLDAAQAPDMLADAFHRAPSMGEPDGPSPWRRMGVIMLALVIAVASTVFAVSVFDRDQSGPAGKADVLPYPLAYTGADVPDPHWTHGQLWLMDEAGHRITLASVPGEQRAVPAWSPDGSQIAFAAELDDLGTQIWVINADGTDLHEVTRMVPMDGSAINDAPAWSPDGTQIAFNCYDGSMHEVCVVNADGSGNPRKLTDGINVAHDTPPVWLGSNEFMFSTSGSAGCEDGGQSCDDPATGGTFILPLDESKPTRIGTARPQMTLSPDRDRIAFLCPTKAGYAICTERTDLTGREQVTSPPTDLAAAITDSDSFPVWLPDGRLSFVRESRAFDGFHLYVVDAHGGDPIELANLGNDIRGISWGPAPGQDGLEPTVSTEPRKPEGSAPKLGLLWSEPIADTAAPAEILMDGDRIYVPTATGVVAYPVDCSARCEPLWHGDVGSGISLPDVAAGEGIVVIVDPAKGAWVFDGDCATDGSGCQPSWSVRPGPGEHFSSPSIDNGIVRLTGGTGEAPDQHVRVLAFPADCSGSCDPAWTADEGTGTVYASVTNLDSVGYQQVGMAMYGFRSDCRSDGGVCAPDLQIQASGDPHDQSSSIYGPVGDSSVVVFSAGDGNLYGYAPHCGQSCTPTWVGSAGNYIEAYPVLHADVVYISASDGIVGFPLHCEAQCQPVMRADLGDYLAIEGADAQGLIAVSHFGRRPQIVALPADCAGTCEPSWTASPGGDIHGVLAQDSFLAVGSSGDSMETYPRRCSDPCQATERFSIGGEAWWMFVTGDRLIVGARSGEVSSTGLTLSVFQIT